MMGNIDIQPGNKKRKLIDAMVEKHFNSKPEAYTYIIYMLLKWREHFPIEGNSTLDEVIETFKIAYENHEQNITILEKKLNSLLVYCNHEFNEPLQFLIFNLNNIQKNISNDTNILARRFESEFACQLIQSPTKKMMEVIGELSNAIIKVIEEYSHYESDSPEYGFLDFFLTELEGSDILFGAFKEKPTYSTVISILKENNPQNFLRIQFIAFMFARNLVGPLPLNNLPPHDPTGLFAKILDKYLQATVSKNQNERSFSYQKMAAKNDSSEDKQGPGFLFRTFITNKLFYGDELYTQGANRGRKGPRKTHLNTNQLGLMKLHHSMHSNGLAVIPEQMWCADAQAQDADADSIYYKTALSNDCPYITGPSGMTSVFMNMLFLLLNPQKIEAIQAYSLGILAYIVGAGFHSINEIVIPLAKCIDLLPDYPAYQGLEYLSRPPLYNLYFNTIGTFDPEFNQLREQIWCRYLDYFESCYMPLCMNEFCKDRQVSQKISLAPEVKMLQQLINDSINNCIDHHRQNSSLALRFLGDQTADIIALRKLQEACSEESSLKLIMAHLQKYFAGEYALHSTAMHKAENDSFIRFFIALLKDCPQVLSHINEELTFDPPLIIHSNSNVFSSEFKMECFKLHKQLKEDKYTGQNVYVNF